MVETDVANTVNATPNDMAFRRYMIGTIIANLILPYKMAIPSEYPLYVFALPSWRIGLSLLLVRLVTGIVHSRWLAFLSLFFSLL